VQVSQHQNGCTAKVTLLMWHNFCLLHAVSGITPAPLVFAAKLYLRCLASQAAWSYPTKFVLCPQVKAYLADPSAFASSAPEAGAGGDSAPAEEKKEEAKAEEEEESDEDMGFSLFD